MRRAGPHTSVLKLHPLHRADRRLESVGLDPYCGVEDTPFPWMNEIMDLPKEKNFFESRVTEYQAAIGLDWN
jgi:ribonucleoside-diphosphate reductase beta chain